MGTVKWDKLEMVMIGTEDGSETGDAKELIDFTKQSCKTIDTYGTCIKVFYNTFISAKVS